MIEEQDDQIEDHEQWMNNNENKIEMLQSMLQIIIIIVILLENVKTAVIPSKLIDFHLTVSILRRILFVHFNPFNH